MRRYAGRRNGECLSSIKHVVGVRSVASGKEIAHRIAVKNHAELLPQREMANNQSVRRHLEAFTRGRIIGKLEEGRSVTRTAIRGFSSGHHEEPHPQMTGTLSYRPEAETGGRQRRNRQTHDTGATGRPISRFIVARRLDGGGLIARRPVQCVHLTPAHREGVLCGAGNTGIEIAMNGGRVLFTDESRFSLSSDSHRILIWRERRSRNHPSNIIERDRRYGSAVLFMDDKAHRTVAAEQLLDSRRLGSSYLTTSNDSRALRLALKTDGQQCLNISLHPHSQHGQTLCNLPSSQGRSVSPTKDQMFLAGHPSQGCFGLQSHCAPCYFQSSFFLSL
ncbi:transposable element Tcb2 transposase [Trichonephila clavipes]|nr:transposable element Tcb2 transposase [Trichonephila clavipes]